MKYQPNRRQFVRGLGSAGSAALGLGAFASRLSAAPKRSRYLINLQGFGGWDSSWHHSPQLVKDTAGLAAGDLQDSFYGVIPTERFPDSMARSFSTGYVGPTFAAYSDAELSQLLIWRGLVAEGSHSVGNHLIQDGHLSGYAASYSVIVADALSRAPDYSRTLHYVQLTQDPMSFDAQVGFYHGPGVPLNIPDTATWTRLSSTDPNDPAKAAADKTMLDATITKLSGETARFKLDATKQLFSGDYANSYTQASAIMGKNYATSQAFKDTIAVYHKAVVADLTTVLFNSPGGQPLLTAMKLLPNLPAASAAVESFLNSNIGNIDSFVYNYALTDFLVTNDLSAVVDLPMAYGDYHDHNDRDCLGVAASLACLRQLMAKLKATQAPDGSGDSLLDCTLIVVSTEFDRQVARTVNAVSESNRPGTNHGPSSSVMMAGYGVNNGKILGGRGTGSGGVFGGIGSFLDPLPVDAATGLPSASGVAASQRAVLPTVLAIFGIPVPSQQRTEQVALAPVIKPGHTT